jgi:ABC-2 type transport system permease protein
MTINASSISISISKSPLERMRWAIVDAWTIASRDLLHWVRQPVQIIIGLLFPVMMVLMFGFLLGGGMKVPGGGSYLELLMPGMFVMTMVFGIDTTFASMATDANRGVTDRFRSMPMAPSAVVVGRSMADMLNSILGLLVMIGCGLLVGWRWHGSIGEAALAIGLLLLLRFAILWVGIYMGLSFKNPEAMTAVQILEWPFIFLSNMFTLPQTMPGWVGLLAEWNPLSATISATRELFGNPGAGGTSWIAQHGLLMAIVWPLMLIAVFFPLSVWRYRRLSH